MNHPNNDTVFVGGSRLGMFNAALPDPVIAILNYFMQKEVHLLVGDAPGADSLVQNHLTTCSYEYVSVFHSPPGPRLCANSNWEQVNIGAGSKATGRALRELKDHEMARQAKSGFMILEPFHKNRYGKLSTSRGTLNNMCNLIAQGKEVSTYFSPTGEIASFDKIDQLIEYLNSHQWFAPDNEKSQALLRRATTEGWTTAAGLFVSENVEAPTPTGQLEIEFGE